MHVIALILSIQVTFKINENLINITTVDEYIYMSFKKIEVSFSTFTTNLFNLIPKFNFRVTFLGGRKESKFICQIHTKFCYC